MVTIARKSTSVKRPEEATQLLNEIVMFLKPGEEKQNNRIKRISELAVEIYGIERSKQVTQVYFYPCSTRKSFIYYLCR